MQHELLMPKLGLTMTEGTLVEWMVAPGTAFQAGQSLFVVESEKAAIEVPAEAAGVLRDICVQPGVTLPVGAVIGHWDGVDGEVESSGLRQTGCKEVSAAPAAEGTQNVAAIARSEPVGGMTDGRVPVTPLARRLAVQYGVNLADVRGSGPRGRIRARDVEGAKNFQPPVLDAPVTTTDGNTVRPATAVEQTIARRLIASKQDIPHFYLSVEAELSKVQTLRRELNAGQNGLRFTLNHFIVAAVGRALAESPQVNRVWTAEGIVSLGQTDVGMAVNTGRGLLVPVLRNVGRQPLGMLVREADAAIERAQAGRLSASDMAGGAITVSNAGMYGASYMASIINPGQSMILGVGRVRELFRPDTDGRPELRRELGMVLSADHRVLDGVAALGFLKCVVYHLEQPLTLLVA